MKKVIYSQTGLPGNSKRLLGLFALSMFWITTSMAQNPVIGSVNYGSWTKILQAPVDTARWMQFPRAAYFDVQSGTTITRKVLFNWSEIADKVEYPASHGWAGSINEAVTLNSPVPHSTAGTNSLDLTNVIKRNTDGVLIDLPAYFGNDGSNAAATLHFDYRTSADNGATWTMHTGGGSITGFGTGIIVAGFHFHRGFIQDADGTLYAVAYCQFNPGTGYQSHRSILVKSTDGGVNWTMVNTIQYTAGISYTESTIERCKDGSILAIMRNDANPLKYRRSSDNGVTWTTVTYVPSIPTNEGVDPYLQMMPNGVLTLSYGDNVGTHDRNTMIAYDPNGTGASWVNTSTTFTKGTGLGNATTAYTATFPTRNNQLMQVTDRGTYAYYGTNPYPSPNPFSIWTKKIDVVFNNDYHNRIDLKTMYHDGKITVSGLTYTTATHPECRQSGAFDASTDYWSGAFANSNSDTYTIDLQKKFRISGISICLQKGVQQSATIEWSADNVTWHNIKTYSNVTHYTVDYTKFTPVVARYVRANVSGSSGMVAITEFNLYTSADNYEDYALNVMPYAYTAHTPSSPGFWVSEGVTPLPTGYHSKRALFMNDDNADNKYVSKVSYPAGAKKTLEFKLKAKAFAPTSGSIQFMVMSGTAVTYQFAVFPSGVIKYYSGSAWNNVGSGPVSFPLDTFKTVKVVVDLTANKDSLFVNNVLIGTNATKQGTATTVNGFRFGSGGSAPVGDKALFDDVDFYDNGTGSPDALAASEVPAATTFSTDLAKQSSAMAVVVSPNPSDDMVKLSIKNCATGKLSVIFSNSFGKTVKSFNFTSISDSFETTVPVNDLPLGIYVITVNQNGLVAQTKLISKKL